MHVRAVVFDLDGTLLDTLADLASSMNRVLEAHGFPTHPTEAYRYFVGEGARVLAARVLPEDLRTPALVETVLQKYLQDYGSNWDVETRAYTGIHDMLDQLRGRGIRLAVLSNKPHDITVSVIERLLEGVPFEVVYGHRDEFARKPDPETALLVAREMALPPENFVYVGDTETDMLTAVAAEMYPVGVRWGFRTEAELAEAGAADILDHPLDLLPVIDRLNIRPLAEAGGKTPV